MTTDRAPGPAIHVQGLGKSYQKLTALDAVDFEVARGSIFADDIDRRVTALLAELVPAGA